MPKFLVQGHYTAAGLNGLLKEKASGRKAAVQAAVKSVKGKMDCLYFGSSGTDVVMIIDVPDSAAAAALSVTVSASGSVELHVTPLMTVEELDGALGLATKYRAPGA
jgi:uncharacterized protein with GYD domain